MTPPGTVVVPSDRSARQRARTALAERLAELRQLDREAGILPGQGLEAGAISRDVLESIAEQITGKDGVDVDPIELSLIQSYQALELVTRDLSCAVTWGWEPLDELMGPMLPGELWLVGATTGNGKSTFLHNLQAGLAQRHVTTLCFPLEVEPELFRLRTACWHLNLDLDAVLSQDWAALQREEDSAPPTKEEVREALAVALETLHRDPHLHVAPPRSITLETLHRWIQWGVEQCGADVVVIDHLHRFDVDGKDAGAYRVAMSNLARQLRDLGRALGVVIICAVQLNREKDPFDDFHPPDLYRIKEAAAIAEEAAGVLMLSRDIDPGADKNTMRAVRSRRVLPSAVERKGCMVVTCRKHRRRGRAKHHSRRLRVTDTERLVPWQNAPSLLGREVA